MQSSSSLTPRDRKPQMDDDTQDTGPRPLEAEASPSWSLPRPYADLSPEERAEFDRRMRGMAALAGQRKRPPNRGFE
jgi:hypothetical protein